MAPISVGELFDKISILEIKQSNTDDPEKLTNIDRELAELRQLAQDIAVPAELYEELKAINLRIWDVEDRIRLYESKRAFGMEFIELARSVYIENDRRAVVKRQINRVVGSYIIEEKIY